MAEKLSTRLTAREGRKFAISVGAAFLIFSGILWWQDHHKMAQIFGGFGMLLSAAGALVPTRLGPLYRAWMGFAHVISKVTTPIFMGFVYFVVIFPIGVGMRLFGRNPIHHRLTGGSYWFRRNQRRSDLTEKF